MSGWGPADGGDQYGMPPGGLGPGGGQMMPASDGSEAFVTYARGILKIFNVAKNFGFVSPVFRSEDSEGPPLDLGSADGLWFFGNHYLQQRTQLGTELTFEIWESAPGKAQARNVKAAAEMTVRNQPEERVQQYDRDQQRRHPNEPKVIYPSVYISDVPVEYTEREIRELHRQMGLNPETIMGLKYLPFTEVSLGMSDGSKAKVSPVTGAIIIRYLNDDAANAAVERLKGHPIRTSNGETKYLGAKHAAPAKWVLERRKEEEDKRKETSSRGESLMQKVTGTVSRVSMAGFGVIKSAEWGEVMWRQYELPTNIRTMQFADPNKFKREVEKRDEYARLREFEGKDVEAELYKLPDGQVRAWRVRLLQPGGMPSMHDGRNDGAAAAAGFGMGAPQGGPPPHGGLPLPPPPGPPPPPDMSGQMPPPGAGMPPGMPPAFGDPFYQAQMMQMMQMHMMQKKDKKERKEKKEKKDKKRRRSSSPEAVGGAPAKRRQIDDDDF